MSMFLVTRVFAVLPLPVSAGEELLFSWRDSTREKESWTGRARRAENVEIRRDRPRREAMGRESWTIAEFLSRGGRGVGRGREAGAARVHVAGESGPVGDVDAGRGGGVAVERWLGRGGERDVDIVEPRRAEVCLVVRVAGGALLLAGRVARRGVRSRRGV